MNQFAKVTRPRTHPVLTIQHASKVTFWKAAMSTLARCTELILEPLNFSVLNLIVQAKISAGILSKFDNSKLCSFHFHWEFVSETPSVWCLWADWTVCFSSFLFDVIKGFEQTEKTLLEKINNFFNFRIYRCDNLSRLCLHQSEINFIRDVVSKN